MHRGYIKSYRRIKESWLWKDKPFANGQAWIDMLLRASWCDKELMSGLQKIELKSGEFITSVASLSEAWGWGNKKVRNFLDLLERETMIVQKKTNKFTLINIVKFDTYQSSDIDEGQTKGKQKANEGQTKGNEEEVIKNLKEDKIKKTTSVASEKIAFDTSSSTLFFPIGKRELLQSKYPAVNLDAEILKAEAWLMANPKNKKSNYERFLINWLTRAQDRAPRWQGVVEDKPTIIFKAPRTPGEKTNDR